MGPKQEAGRSWRTSRCAELRRRVSPCSSVLRAWVERGCFPKNRALHLGLWVADNFSVGWGRASERGGKKQPLMHFTPVLFPLTSPTPSSESLARDTLDLPHSQFVPFASALDDHRSCSVLCHLSEHQVGSHSSRKQAPASLRQGLWVGLRN